MKKNLLLIGVALVFATTTHAQSTPSINTPIGQVIDLHGLPSVSGKYVQWAASSDGELGWLKQNPDGSWASLFIKFRNGVYTSANITGIYVWDSKTNIRTSLLPNASKVNWVISWVGPNYVILNRNPWGLYYGPRGTPSTVQTKEISSAIEEPKFNLSVDLSKGPQPPTAAGAAGSLGTYTISINSNKPLINADLEVIAEIDDRTGKTVRQDILRVPPTSSTALNTSIEYVLGNWHALLPSGDYTLHIEVKDRRAPVAGGKFVAGATKIFTLRTITTR